MAESGRSGSGSRQSVRIMTKESNSGEQGRSKKEKSCIRCEYIGILSEDKLCGSCMEEVKKRREICDVCKHWVETSGAECSRCGYWKHKNCEGLTEAGLKIIQSMEVWFCKSCCKEWKGDKAVSAEMKEELKMAKKKNAEIAKKMVVLEDKIIENQNQVVVVEDERNIRNQDKEGRAKDNREIIISERDGVSNQSEEGEEMTISDVRRELQKLWRVNEETRKFIGKVEERWIAKEEEMVQKITDRVVENMVEIQEKERRKKNIVMFNVPEEKRGQDKQNEDGIKAICESIFHDVLRVRDAIIGNIFRIGKENEGRVRPLVVELNDVGVKWALVSKSKELGQNEGSTIKHIIIAPDLTRKEREENVELEEELREKRAQGGRWIIRKGRIVRLFERN